MSTKLATALKSFLKFELYTALTIAGAQIAAAGSLDLVQWPMLWSAVVAGLVKGALSYWATQNNV